MTVGLMVCMTVGGWTAAEAGWVLAVASGPVCLALGLSALRADAPSPRGLTAQPAPAGRYGLLAGLLVALGLALVGVGLTGYAAPRGLVPEVPSASPAGTTVPSTGAGPGSAPGQAATLPPVPVGFVWSSYGGGSPAAQLPPTVVVRNLLSTYALGVYHGRDETERARARQDLERMMRVPTLEVLQRMVEVESRAYAGDAEAARQVMAWTQTLAPAGAPTQVPSPPAPAAPEAAREPR